MSRLIELKSANGNTSFFIESSDIQDNGGVQQATSPMEKQFDKIMERVKPFCETIINNFQSLSIKPDSASAEFGLSVTAEGNLFVVKASGEASLKIILNWNNLKH
jgi:hypothetical protein